MIFDLLPYLAFAVALPVFLIATSVKVIREYERAVVFLLGRFQRVNGPSLIVLVPGVQRWSGSTCGPASSTCRART